MSDAFTDNWIKRIKKEKRNINKNWKALAVKAEEFRKEQEEKKRKNLTRMWSDLHNIETIHEIRYEDTGESINCDPRDLHNDLIDLFDKQTRTIKRLKNEIKKLRKTIKRLEDDAFMEAFSD